MAPKQGFIKCKNVNIHIIVAVAYIVGLFLGQFRCTLKTHLFSYGIAELMLEKLFE